jgi:precorrin-6B methylase 2
MPCCSHAVPLPCHEYAFLKATSQGDGTFVEGSRRQGDGMLTAYWRLATPSSGKFVIRSILISDAVASVKHSTLGEWQGSGRVAAGERHGMCE